MSLTSEIFKDQHTAILKLADHIESYINSGSVKDPYALRSLLSRFIGKLQVHLDMEHHCFIKCPSHQDDAFFDKHGQSLQNFRKAFDAYVKEWKSPSTIREQETSFIKETKALLSQFRIRVKAEEMQFQTMAAKTIAA